MKRINLVQGSPEWKAYRKKYDSASEASMMMAESLHVKRDELLYMKATGTEQEFSEWFEENVLQRGHDVEESTRPYAEQLIAKRHQMDEDDAMLFPVTGVNDAETMLSSYDGLTDCGRFSWEGKQFNKEKFEVVKNENRVPVCDYWQVIHQLVTSDGSIEEALYTVGDGTPEGTAHCWVTLNDIDKDRLIQGWLQFNADRDSYVVAEPKPEAVAEEVTDLPAISMVAKGEVAIVDNLEVFEKGLTVFLQKSLIKEPSTDNDFATLDLQIKALKKAEAALKTAGESVLAQVEAVDAAMKKKDSLAELVRQNRLASEKLLKAKKDQIKRDIVDNAEKDIDMHIALLEQELEAMLSNTPVGISVSHDIQGAIKGKKTIASLQSSANDEVARAKIAANQMAERIRVNIEHFDSVVNDIPKTIFGDLPSLLLKEAGDFVAAVSLRIHEYEKQIEEQAERKRQQDEAEAKRKAEAQAAADQVTQAHEEEYHEAPANPLADIPVKSGSQVKAETTTQTLAGDLCRYCRDKGLTPSDAQELMALVEKYTNLDAQAA